MSNIKHIVFLFIPFFVCSCISSRLEDSDISALSSEQSFMIANFKENSLMSWEEGKEFVCVTEELPILLYPQIGIRDNYTNSKGNIFRFKRLEETQTWTGKESHIVYEDNNGLLFNYKISKSIDEILSVDFTPLLPELVSLDYIVKADSLLKNKELYIKTANWYTINGTEKRGRKLIPVTVQKVVEGNKIFPFAIIFETERGEEAVVYTTMSASQYMSQYSTFDKLFSFTNPREKYPQIKDEIWNIITLSQVIEGMTKDECQISLGLPDEISQIPEYSGLRERWIYKTGTFLEFKDGLLVKFRLM